MPARNRALDGSVILGQITYINACADAENRRARTDNGSDHPQPHSIVRARNHAR